MRHVRHGMEPGDTLALLRFFSERESLRVRGGYRFARCRLHKAKINSIRRTM